MKQKQIEIISEPLRDGRRLVRALRGARTLGEGIETYPFYFFGDMWDCFYQFAIFKTARDVAIFGYGTICAALFMPIEAYDDDDHPQLSPAILCGVTENE